MSNEEEKIEKKEEETSDGDNPLLLLSDLLGDSPDKDPIRKIGVIGDIAEENTSDIVYGLLVMSAGVLLLAAGTKGKRRIGKYCRIMLHNVSAGSIGALAQMQNELKEIEKIQKQYIEILASETKMTEKQIKRLINKNVNVYLSAEEALELGIVDEII